MIALVVIVGIWLAAIGVLVMSRDTGLDVNRALSSDEPLVSTPELDGTANEPGQGAPQDEVVKDGRVA